MRDAASASVVDPPGLLATAIGAPLADIELDASPSLPGNHPMWQRDVLAVSARVRAIAAALRPLAVRVLTFWDHAVRSINVGQRRIEVDPSGSYRLR
ncbi:MAG: hypothetical protein JWN27_2340 [Candidatus Eremiobacteraeota bacterium]|nr:hypothetical protein [Candidatus Eremiobacteraeota bacterium]